jgi:2'-5' RNA ligase
MAALMLQIPQDTSRVLNEIQVSGERESNHHITVIHLGKDVPIEAIADMLPVLYDVTSKQAPFSVSTRTVTTFPKGDDGTPIICKVESPALHKFRAEMKAALDAAKIKYSNNFPDYKPHVTLAYDKEMEGGFTQDIPTVSWGVTEMLLWGSNRGTGRLVVKFPFSLPGTKTANVLQRACVQLAIWSQTDDKV